MSLRRTRTKLLQVGSLQEPSGKSPTLSMARQKSSAAAETAALSSASVKSYNRSNRSKLMLDGRTMVVLIDGTIDDAADGSALGTAVADGASVLPTIGALVGISVGMLDGARVGVGVGLNRTPMLLTSVTSAREPLPALRNSLNVRLQRTSQRFRLIRRRQNDPANHVHLSRPDEADSQTDERIESGDEAARFAGEVADALDGEAVVLRSVRAIAVEVGLSEAKQPHAHVVADILRPDSFAGGVGRRHRGVRGWHRGGGFASRLFGRHGGRTHNGRRRRHHSRCTSGLPRRKDLHHQVGNIGGRGEGAVARASQRSQELSVVHRKSKVVRELVFQLVSWRVWLVQRRHGNLAVHHGLFEANAYHQAPPHDAAGVPSGDVAARAGGQVVHALDGHAEVLGCRGAYGRESSCTNPRNPRFDVEADVRSAHEVRRLVPPVAVRRRCIRRGQHRRSGHHHDDDNDTHGGAKEELHPWNTAYEVTGFLRRLLEAARRLGLVSSTDFGVRIAHVVPRR
eukprot:scaffold616_cov257-Pinguiococcus_pyrenoidosus.AAC.24